MMSVVSLRSYDVMLGYFSHLLLLLHAMFGIYSNTQNRSAACTIGLMGHYTGIPRNCLSIFKLGPVFALVSQFHIGGPPGLVLHETALAYEEVSVVKHSFFTIICLPM